MCENQQGKQFIGVSGGGEVSWVLPANLSVSVGDTLEAAGQQQPSVPEHNCCLCNMYCQLELHKSSAQEVKMAATNQGSGVCRTPDPAAVARTKFYLARQQLICSLL